jgi:hypothetical protein
LLRSNNIELLRKRLRDNRKLRRRLTPRLPRMLLRLRLLKSNKLRLIKMLSRLFKANNKLSKDKMKSLKLN